MCKCIVETKDTQTWIQINTIFIFKSLNGDLGIKQGGGRIRPRVPGRGNLSPHEVVPPPASQLREDGAPHPGALCCCGALGRAALPRDSRYTGSTGWAVEVEGAVTDTWPSPSVSLSHCAPSPVWKRVSVACG